MRTDDPIRATADDHLLPEIGDWGLEKYRLIQAYADLFTRAMQGTWHHRVYIDLFAGAGKSRIRDRPSVVHGTPLLALRLEKAFDRYIFCESNRRRMAALQTRVRGEYPGADVRYVPGNANAVVDKIVAELPQPSPANTMLCFCLSDPCKLANLRFETIRRLSRFFMDHLVLVPTDMDGHRNISTYEKPANDRIEAFTGIDDWRDRWALAKLRGAKFNVFLMDLFGEAMTSLGYRYPGIESTWLIRSTGRNLRLYRLALFSRHDLGTTFWAEARKYGTPQMEIPF